MLKRTVPKSVIKRMTKYLAYVQMLSADGVQWVYSRELAESLGLTSSTVRQDLLYIDFVGVSKRGYEVAVMEKALAKALGADRPWNTAVIGAGNLGRALSLHGDFLESGFNICAVFDVDPKKIGTRIGRLSVKSMSALTAVVKKRKIDIGILAVPAAAAQTSADLLILSGIKGLLNMSPEHIVTPRSVPVVEARVVAGLQELTHHLVTSNKSR